MAGFEGWPGMMGPDGVAVSWPGFGGGSSFVAGVRPVPGVPGGLAGLDGWPGVVEPGAVTCVPDGFVVDEGWLVLPVVGASRVGEDGVFGTTRDATRGRCPGAGPGGKARSTWCRWPDAACRFWACCRA